MKKEWKIRNYPADYKEIGKKLGVSPVIVRCIRNRNRKGVDDLVTAEQMDHFLNDTLDDLYDPLLMKGIREAVDLLLAALQGSAVAPVGSEEVQTGSAGDGRNTAGPTSVAIASDYDCDGICSGLILKIGLSRAGFSADIYTPDRATEGYGLNRRIVDDALAAGHTLLITCDNGVAAVDAVTYAKEKGMTVIVTDHHEPQEELPPADVIIDPKQEGETYPFAGLCGAGVTYKLITQLLMEVGGSVSGPAVGATGESASSDAPCPGSDLLQHELLELAAVATVADVMELVDENRILVKYGLRSLRHTKSPGFQSLLQALRLGDKPLRGSDIGFRIGPTLNVAGRISDVAEAFSLLEEKDPVTANKKAGGLVELNEKRKKMTEDGVKLALQDLSGRFPKLDDGEMDDVLVIYLPGVHESLVGLIAGRIKERFNHPTIALTDAVGESLDRLENDENDTGSDSLLRGSGRSIAPYDMFEHLSGCKDLMEKFGGHKMAAGLTMKKKNLDEFCGRLNTDSGLCAEDFVPELLIDLEVPISYINLKLIAELDQMGPFGVANPRPIFAQRDLQITQIRYMGTEKQHLKLYVKDDKNVQLEALAFSRAAEFDDEVILTYGEDELADLRVGRSDKRITLAYQPEVNEYNGFTSIQLMIVDWCI